MIIYPDSTQKLLNRCLKNRLLLPFTYIELEEDYLYEDAIQLLELSNEIKKITKNASNMFDREARRYLRDISSILSTYAQYVINHKCCNDSGITNSHSIDFEIPKINSDWFDVSDSLLEKALCGMYNLKGLIEQHHRKDFTSATDAFLSSQENVCSAFGYEVIRSNILHVTEERYTNQLAFLSEGEQQAQHLSLLQNEYLALFNTIKKLEIEKLDQNLIPTLASIYAQIGFFLTDLSPIRLAM